MFSKLILLVFVTNFLLKSNYACVKGEDCEHRRQEKATPFFASIGYIFRKIKQAIFGQYENNQVKEQVTKNREWSVFLDEMTRKKRIEDKMEIDLHIGEIHSPSGFTTKPAFESRPEMTAGQLITAHGYLSESHTALTQDGFMITMHRVRSDFDTINQKIVILHHGLLGSSEDWLLQGSRALPYMLTENGYDVWLLNGRGNRYSRSHVNKSTEYSNFWDFSWHEMGVYDLPAAIKYITEITASSELHFIGHSMGGTALLVLLSSMPHYNKILKSAVLLAPLAFMYRAKGPIKTLANFCVRNGRYSLAYLGQNEFMRDEIFPESIIKKYCKANRNSCVNNLLLFGSGGAGAWDQKMQVDVLAHVPAGASVKTLVHYVQLVNSGYFQMYNYGVENNLKKYRNVIPSLYNLNAISLPITLFSSPSDWLASTSDIQTLLGMLREVTIHHVVKADNFGHFDFLWSPDAAQLIYNIILPILDQKAPIRKSSYNCSWKG